MGQTWLSEPSSPGKPESHAAAQAAHFILRIAAAVMARAVLLGGLYFATETRQFGAKTPLPVNQTGRDRLDASISSKDMNDKLPNQTASPGLKQNGGKVRGAGLGGPVIAAKPISLNYRRVILMSALCGFSLALGLAILFHALKDRARRAMLPENPLPEVQKPAICRSTIPDWWESS
jgi:hypothetical protein